MPKEKKENYSPKLQCLLIERKRGAFSQKAWWLDGKLEGVFGWNALSMHSLTFDCDLRKSGH